jgi:hypothetical protein
VFVQVIKGTTSDLAGLEAQGQRWTDEVRPGAVGFLGGTFGVTDDGTFVVLARFEDEASARANSDRPEQGAWWDVMATFVDGDATFRESSDVSLLFEGGSDDAGFVQVMEGTVTDRAKADAIEKEMVDQLRAARPDLLGAIRVWFDGGAYLEAAYFTNEDAARQGETSADFEGPHEGFADLFGEMTFLDLHHPQYS